MNRPLPLLTLIALTALLPFWLLRVGLAAPQATIRHVATTGTNSGNCSNAAAPCATVQYAHDQAAAGDTIQIAPGTYNGNVALNRSITLQGADAVTTILQGTGSGGTVENFANPAASITVRRLTIRGGQYGIAAGSPLLIEAAIIRDNHPPVGNHGGGVWVWGATTIRHSAIFSNTGLYGGGIDASGPLTISHSAIHHNEATETGGGIHLGGNTVALIENSTLSSNRSGPVGSAIFLATAGIELTVRHTTITANQASGNNSVAGIGTANGTTIRLFHTIIANNLGTHQCSPTTGTWQSLGYNLGSDGSCRLTGTGDRPNTNPFLSPLADNGGPTRTHALAAGSPALDGGNNVDCPATDQRGRVRPYDGDGNGSAICDIGAFESGSTDTPPPQNSRHVATSGSDSGNDCLNQAAPCRTIQHAVNQAFAGETVQIAAGTYVENVIIDKSVVLHGADPLTTILDGGGQGRVVTIRFDPVVVTLRNLTLRNGVGGLLTGSGPTRVENSRIHDNQGDPNSGLNRDGGGIHSLGPLTVSGSAIFANSALYGGGIHARAALTVMQSAVHDNVSAESGGGIYAGLSAGQGVEIVNSTVSGNQSTGNGGGIQIASSGTPLLLHHATIALNRVPGSNSVAGIGTAPGVQVTLRNSVVAHNEGRYQCHTGSGTWLSVGNNLASDGSCGLDQAGDRPNTNPFLGPLADNGGPTRTHALLGGSPAVDAGNADHCLATDQREENRPIGSTCDIGAYEADGTEPPGAAHTLWLPLVVR